MKTATITLAGQLYEVGPLNLGQMKQIGIGTAKWGDFDPKSPGSKAKAEDAWYEGTFDILSAALGKPRVEIESLQGVTLIELIDANAKILEASGLKSPKEDNAPKMGEAQGAIATG